MIDIFKISDEVHNKHAHFIKKYGFQLDKLGADHRLYTQKLTTKLITILQPFVKEGVIDEPLISVEDGFTQIALKKKGMLGALHLVTDGKVLIVKEHNIKIHFGLTTAMAREYHNVFDGFDWTKFALDLLDMIHGVIYGRKDAVSLRIFGRLV